MTKATAEALDMVVETSAFTDWKDIFWRVYQRIQKDRVLAVAAGVVFYMLLALFPALAALVSLYGLFTDPTLINAHHCAAHLPFSTPAR